MNLPRISGLLLHPTSLPSMWGVGDLGPSAFRFLDLLEAGKQSIWQILPLTPVARHGSPYSAHSLFGGNTLLLSPEKLVEDGYLHQLPDRPLGVNERIVDFGMGLEFKDRLVQAAFKECGARVLQEKECSEFRDRNSHWLDDFALYVAISKELGAPWYEWPEGLRRRERSTLEEKRVRLGTVVNTIIFSQFLFERQWRSLQEYARSKGIMVLGDLPFYVLQDSADIWAHRELFKVDADGRALFVGGVPPDYFSSTGQRWGNPVYDWQRLDATGYDWWEKRVRRSLEFADMLRLDHFRGYVAYWEIPASSPTAVEGSWVELPTTFLEFVKTTFPGLPFLAEDLGLITKDVVKARELLGIPGMRVLQFAFNGSPDNIHLPTNHVPNSFAYTGTHDTNTVRGWYEEEASSKEKEVLAKFLGHEVTPEGVAWDLISVALGSSSMASIIPLQDLLGLGSQARMNNPATLYGNWRWRASGEDLREDLFGKLGDQTATCGRD